MQPAYADTYWNRLSVSGKLAALTALFGVSLAALIAISVLALKNQQADAAIADAMGRQRFLLVRYYVDVLQAAQGARSDHVGVKRVFDANLASMLSGGPVQVSLLGDERVTVPPPSDEIATKLREQRSQAGRLELALNRYLAMPPAERAANPGLLDQMAEARVAATTVADEAAKLFITQSQRRVNSAILLQLLLGAGVLALGSALAYVVGRSISRPLQSCVAMAEAITAGDLSQPPIPVTSGDEGGRLAAAFNAMRLSLRAITEESRTTAARLSDSVQEILGSIQEQASSTRQQAAAVQEITTTVEEIGQSALQVAEMARHVGAAADAMAASGQSGLQSVRDATTAMEAIRVQTENAAETIVALSERTQAIGEIISTVNEIAEQSNLVALNAAIEAAGAGEHGRRFAVVAGEMKALADQAREATRQVRSILEQTQRNISSSVLLIEEALKRVGVGREKAQGAEEVIHRMAEGVQETSGSFQQVVGATGQQQIGLEQISQGLQQIRQASVQTATGTDQLAKAAENVGQLGTALTRLMGKYRL